MILNIQTTNRNGVIGEVCSRIEECEYGTAHKEDEHDGRGHEAPHDRPVAANFYARHPLDVTRESDYSI